MLKILSELEEINFYNEQDKFVKIMDGIEKDFGKTFPSDYKDGLEKLFQKKNF